MSPRRSTAEAEAPVEHELFRYEARRDGRPVAVLRGVESGGVITVETEVYPVTRKPEERATVHRPFTFHSRDHARRFADDALTALEYLNCAVVD